MKEIILFFAVQVLEENLVLAFTKYVKEKMNGILRGVKTLRERILKESSSLKYIIPNVNL